MKIYKVWIAARNEDFDDTYKYFANKEKAEKFVKDNNKPWVNFNGIPFNTVKIIEEIEVED